MNKNKIYLTLAVLSLVGMIGQYMYYETQVLADHGTNEYTIPYTDKLQIRTIENQENVKGCELLHTDFTSRDGSNGILTFTCDNTRQIEPLRQLDREQMLQEIAIERGIELTGIRLP